MSSEFLGRTEGPFFGIAMEGIGFVMSSGRGEEVLGSWKINELGIAFERPKVLTFGTFVWQRILWLSKAKELGFPATQQQSVYNVVYPTDFPCPPPAGRGGALLEGRPDDGRFSPGRC